MYRPQCRRRGKKLAALRFWESADRRNKLFRHVVERAKRQPAEIRRVLAPRTSACALAGQHASSEHGRQRIEQLALEHAAPQPSRDLRIVSLAGRAQASGQPFLIPASGLGASCSPLHLSVGGHVNTIETAVKGDRPRRRRHDDESRRTSSPPALSLAYRLPQLPWPMTSMQSCCALDDRARRSTAARRLQLDLGQSRGAGKGGGNPGCDCRRRLTRSGIRDRRNSTARAIVPGRAATATATSMGISW